MQKFTIYKHYKGGKYIFYFIAIPAEDDAIFDNEEYSTFTAFDIENRRWITLYRRGNIVYSLTDKYLAIYRNIHDKYGVYLYARPLNSFFEIVTNKNGEYVNKFMELND